MAVPGIQRNDERPPGILPRNVQYLVIGGIALIIVGATFWSGGAPRKPVEPAPSPGPSPNQLRTFQQMLERQHDEEKQEAERRLTSLRERSAAEPPPLPVSAGVPVTTTSPIEEEKRKRAATAPFASNYAVRTEVMDESDERDSRDRTSQIAITPAPKADVKSGPPAPPDHAPPHPAESGRRLPLREGDLYRLFEGTLVHATLANRLEGSFTGPVNCGVSAAVLSDDGAALLIPKGSRFLGKANRVEEENQTRLAVTFRRLILPNGYSVELDAAPGLDSAGEAGLKGKVNNHNLRKFGLAGAVGLLGGLALYGAQGNPYAAGVANSTGNAATGILSHYLNALPSITIPEGHPVNIYIPTDLLMPAYRP